MTWLRGRRVVAAAGIGDFAGFAGRLADGGARVRDLAWPDHHRYRSQDVRRMVVAARDVDAVIITEKDAVKLRHLWPAGGPQPLVARLDVIWSDGGRLLAAPLDRLAARAHLHTLN